MDSADDPRQDAGAFERLVVEELDRLPDAMVERLENVAFVVEDAPESDEVDDLAPDGAEQGPTLLGRYDGVDVTRRDRYGFGELPDRIVLYRLPLIAATEDEAALRAEVRTTLIHEIGHYYGLDDERLHELGWA